MPDSSWTETGSSISLVPVTSIIDPGSGPNNINYLTNSNKIALMSQYAAELAMKTSLDTLAGTWSVSATAYNNSVAAINTTLVGFGAPSNWATTWPDGTLSGPWVGVQTLLSANWSAIATQRTALQTAIGAAQAAAAQAAAVSAAATNTITKLNTMALTSPSAGAWASTAKPSLPNGTYPAGSCWLSTDGLEFQVNADGSAWETVTVAATGLFGKIVTSQLTVANFDNLIPNPNSELATPVGGWGAAVEGVQVSLTSGNAYSGVGCRAFTGPSGNPAYTNLIPCAPGDVFTFQAMGMAVATTDSGLYLYLSFRNAAGGEVGGFASPVQALDWFGYRKITVTGTAPAGTVGVVMGPLGGTSGVTYYLDALYARRCCDASVIVDGTITSTKIAAGAITGNMITAGVLTAGVIYFTDGFCLNTLEPKEAGANVTSAHVLTATAQQSSTATATISTPVVLPGLSFSLNAASTSDVYNFFGSMSGAQTNGTPGDDCYIRIGVDGVYSSSYLITYPVLNGTVSNSIIISLTGLSAGAHTITFKMSSGNSGDTYQMYPGTTILCQRIF